MDEPRAIIHYSIKDRRNSPVCFDSNVVIGVNAFAEHWWRNSCCVVISPYFIETQIVIEGKKCKARNTHRDSWVVSINSPGSDHYDSVT